MSAPITPEEVAALRENLANLRTCIHGFKVSGDFFASEKSHYVKNKAAREFMAEAGLRFSNFADQGTLQLDQAEAIILRLLSQEEPAHDAGTGIEVEPTSVE